MNPIAEKETTIRYPQDIPQLLDMSDEAFVSEMRFLAAAKLYELGKLSSGRAADLAGLLRIDFLLRLHEAGVPVVNLRDEEIELEIQAAAELFA